MKQYIFFYRSSRLNGHYEEFKIEATGMMDALVKANRFKRHIETEIFDINLQFKGVVY
ncbi:hypothetical protein H1D32_04925 [Anaerobacillus sp. CMMVII]|uniref:hypothetical protein n=1 Tax=Anaerobacillus sp. CMMVII TaxID=2755588 RepID=UPI0021B76C96|nr:hypothetical protein [Anaerobacillus sp. CMMVII]MCT8137143.1 hypothetical protein [Anaerobacillus sp. CMMVII]